MTRWRALAVGHRGREVRLFKRATGPREPAGLIWGAETTVYRQPGWQGDVMGVALLALLVTALMGLGYWLGEADALQSCEGVSDKW